MAELRSLVEDVRQRLFPQTRPQRNVVIGRVPDVRETVAKLLPLVVQQVDPIVRPHHAPVSRIVVVTEREVSEFVKDQSGFALRVVSIGHHRPIADAESVDVPDTPATAGRVDPVTVDATFITPGRHARNDEQLEGDVLEIGLDRLPVETSLPPEQVLDRRPVALCDGVCGVVSGVIEPLGVDAVRPEQVDDPRFRTREEPDGTDTSNVQQEIPPIDVEALELIRPEDRLEATVERSGSLFSVRDSIVRPILERAVLHVRSRLVPARHASSDTGREEERSAGSGVVSDSVPTWQHLVDERLE